MLYKWKRLHLVWYPFIWKLTNNQNGYIFKCSHLKTDSRRQFVLRMAIVPLVATLRIVLHYKLCSCTFQHNNIWNGACVYVFFLKYVSSDVEPCYYPVSISMKVFLWDLLEPLQRNIFIWDSDSFCPSVRLNPICSPSYASSAPDRTISKAFRADFVRCCCAVSEIGEE